MKHWDILTDTNNYLESNSATGINAFKALLTKVNEAAAELVVLSFTYENIEAYVKVNGNFELYNDLFGTLSQGRLDELTYYKYEEENSFEDYEYWKFQSLVWELVEVWIVNCFEAARKEIDTKETAYYYKHNHDSLEILDLINCKKKFEKSEFELYVKNNKSNQIELLS